MRMIFTTWLLLVSPLFLLGEEEVREWEIRGSKYKAQMLGYDVDKGVQLKMSPTGKVGFVPLDLVGKIDRKHTLRTHTSLAVVQVISLVRHRENADMLPGLFGRQRPKPPADGWMEAGFGSGFMIGPRHLLTNHHVVKNAEKLRIRTRDDDVYEVDGAVHLDPERDIAVIQLSAVPDPALPALVFRPGEPPETGEAVFTIGHPKGFKDTVSWGEVNALRRKKDFPKQYHKVIASGDDTRYIQTDAVILHGSSGSPLMDDRARVVGVNTFLFGNRIGVAVLASEFEAAVKKASSGEAEPVVFPLQPGPNENPFLRYASVLEPIHTKLLKQRDILNRGPNAIEKIGPHVDAGVAAYQKLIDDPESDEWTRFQAQTYKIEAFAFRDMPEKLPLAVKEADGLLAKYADSVWLGHAAMQLYSGTANLRQAFLQRLSESENLSIDNKYRVNLALLLNAIHRRDHSKSITDFDPAQNRAILEAAHKIVKDVVDDPDVVVKADFQESMSIDMAMRQAELDKLEGTIAPPLVAKDFDGKAHDLEAMKGKVVLVDFFSNECQSCRMLYTYFSQLEGKLMHRPFALLTINLDEPGVLEGLIAQKTVTWPTIPAGTNSPIAKAWNVDCAPAHFIIDHKGVIRFHGTSYLNIPSVDRFLNTLLIDAEEASGPETMGEPIDKLPVPAAMAAPTVSAALKKDLVLHYSFNNDKGRDVLDASGRKTHGTRTEKLTYVAGKHGRGVRITGSDTLVESKDWDLNSSGWKGLTISSWVRLENETATATVISRGSKDSKNPVVYDLTVGGIRGTGSLSIRKGMFRYRGGVHSKAYFAHSRPPLRRWVHVVGTSDGETIRYYVNGVLDSEATMVSKTKAKDSRFNVLTIGKSRSRSKDSHVDGAIDEVMVWERVLDADEVTEVYELAP